MLDPENYDRAALAKTEQAELVDGLVGLYVHVMNDAQTWWRYQGRIVGREGDVLIVQMFEPMIGASNGIWLFPLAELAKEPGHVRLYRDWEDWRRAGDEMQRTLSDSLRAARNQGRPDEDREARLEAEARAMLAKAPAIDIWKALTEPPTEPNQGGIDSTEFDT